jgi:hypothetical protein
LVTFRCLELIAMGSLSRGIRRLLTRGRRQTGARAAPFALASLCGIDLGTATSRGAVPTRRHVAMGRQMIMIG